MTRPIRMLLFSTLYPSSVRPVHGIFVETRLRELLRMGALEAKVVAPVPWFPSADRRFGEYADFAATPVRETRHGIEVMHPRFPLIPKVGMSAAPLLLALASIRPLRRLIREGFDFDLIDAHYYYPDGVAAVMLAHWLDKPVTVTARGSDLNLISKFVAPRVQMRWAARHAQASIGVCNALAEQLRTWTDTERVHVMRNGVDLRRFGPTDRAASRRRLGLDAAPWLLSVGNLVDNKGHDHVIDALGVLSQQWPSARLAIVGDGPQSRSLREHAERQGLSMRVHFVGRVSPESMPDWYNAADVLVLASSREGWANVLLESMACGTPVVTTRVGGSPEVVRDPGVGRLVDDRDGPTLAKAIAALFADPPAREAVRRYAESFSWDGTSHAQLALFRRLVAAPGGSVLA
jgi:teichuronic acid biosynthesis glycosyltransferase TuaC